MKTRPARFLALTPLAALVLAMPALAQTTPAQTGPGPATPATPAPQQLSQEDRSFIQEAATGGTDEIDFGKLADQKTRNDGVKRFAQRMVQDHTRINDQLAALVEPDGITPPTTMDAEHQAERTRLEKMSGARFDRAYIRSQVTDHQQAIQLFQHETDSGQDGQLKSFASETLPTLRDHLRMAQGLQSELTPQARAPGAGMAQSGSSMPSRRRDGADALNREELQRLGAAPDQPAQGQ